MTDLPQTSSIAILQLLLFVDDRPSNLDMVKAIEQFLRQVKQESPQSEQSDLQIINVSDQPYLAEHFKVLMTPALVKVTPPPRQTLVGKNLMAQLRDNWQHWQQQIEDRRLELVPTENHAQSLSYATELVRVADDIFRIQQDKADLEEQLRFKDRIISMLAHDLRSPLTAVYLALETIELSGDRLTSDMAKHLFRQARGQTKIADNMITDILEASKGSTSELQIHLQKMQIGYLCQNAVNDLSLQTQIAAKAQNLVVDIPTDLPLVYADEDRIRQVLTNLLNNAIKYTPVGGEISVGVLHRTAQKLEISITDNGDGIPVEDRDRIFEDHFRLPRDNSKEGYGIGLSVCRRIIRAHYGQIWVDSAGKKGSCFHFTLPVY